MANTQKKVNMEKILNSRCEQLWQPVSGAAIYDFHICFFEGSGVSACNVGNHRNDDNDDDDDDDDNDSNDDNDDGSI